MEPRYLGDGIYFQFEHETASVVLTTGTHVKAQADNIIFLEPEVIINLMKALSDLPKEMKVIIDSHKQN